MVHSDRGGEYSGRYDETGHNPGPFVKYLQEYGIDAHYTMSSTPQHNGIAERRNCTPLNMVRCMLINSSLPEFLWGEALKLQLIFLIKCLISLFLRLHVNYGHRRSQVFVTSMFGVTKRK